MAYIIPLARTSAVQVRVGDQLIYNSRKATVKKITANGDGAPYFWLDGEPEGISYLLLTTSLQDVNARSARADRERQVVRS